MTTASRLSKLELSLTPKQAVRLWLAEARAYGNANAYAALP